MQFANFLRQLSRLETDRRRTHGPSATLHPTEAFSIWWPFVDNPRKALLVELLAWLAEETASPEPGSSPDMLPGGADSAFQAAFNAALCSEEHKRVPHEFLSSLDSWIAHLTSVPPAGPTETHEDLFKRHQPLSAFVDLMYLTNRAMECLQSRPCTQPINPAALYAEFRRQMQKDPGMVEQYQSIRLYCAALGFPDVTKTEQLSAQQASRWEAHMCAGEWLVRLMQSFYSSEVVSRNHRPFDWSKKRICNRLACPMNKAYLAVAKHQQPNVRLGFEAFAGRKLLACAGCQQTYYCCKECQRARWKHHKRFCGMLAQRQTGGAEAQSH